MSKKLTEKKNPQQKNLFHDSIINKKIILNINQIGSNLKEVLEEFIRENYEGKCIVEGIIKKKSSKILTYSSGKIIGNDVEFDVVIECLICFPVEGMNISCVCKNITKAGVRAELDETPSPIVVFLMRDSHYNKPGFSDIKEGDNINIKVIGQRFELNDPFISIIGEHVFQQESKPKIVFE